LNYLLDACALIAYLSEEKGKGFEAVDELLNRAKDKEISLDMNILNMTEVYYNYIREAGMGAANEIMRPVPYFPIGIIRTITDEIYSEAAKLKAGYSLSFANCFLCATAKSLGAVIVTKDSEIRAVEQAENLSVLWIR
jgi:predicted nucleic acid-binding protein